MLVLWLADIGFVRHQAWLDWLAHRAVPVFSILLIVIPSARTFLENHRPSVLMLGCEVLILQISLALAPTAFAHNPNTAFTIYNTSALLAAVCHLLGTKTSFSQKGYVQRPASWLVKTYLAGAGAVTLVAWFAFTGAMPTFFINGQGGTPFRAFVVITAVSLFLLTAILLLQRNRLLPSSFLRWYGVGLILVAMSLSGSLLLTLRDSPLNWVTRGTLILGSFYMWGAVIASRKETRSWRIPGEFSIAAAGPQFEMLFDLSADGIVVHEIGEEDSPGKFLQANEAFCRLLGYSPQEIRRMSLRDVSEAQESKRKITWLKGLKPGERMIHEKDVDCERRSTGAGGDQHPIL